MLALPILMICATIGGNALSVRNPREIIIPVLPVKHEGLSFSEFLKQKIHSENTGQTHQKHTLLSPKDLLEEFRNWDSKEQIRENKPVVKKPKKPLLSAIYTSSLAAMTQNTDTLEPISSNTLDDPQPSMTTLPSTWRPVSYRNKRAGRQRNSRFRNRNRSQRIRDSDMIPKLSQPRKIVELYSKNEDADQYSQNRRPRNQEVNKYLRRGRPTRDQSFELGNDRIPSNVRKGNRNRPSNQRRYDYVDEGEDSRFDGISYKSSENLNKHNLYKPEYVKKLNRGKPDHIDENRYPFQETPQTFELPTNGRSASKKPNFQLKIGDFKPSREAAQYETYVPFRNEKNSGPSSKNDGQDAYDNLDFINYSTDDAKLKSGEFQLKYLKTKSTEKLKSNDRDYSFLGSPEVFNEINGIKMKHKNHGVPQIPDYTDYEQSSSFSEDPEYSQILRNTAKYDERSSQEYDLGRDSRSRYMSTEMYEDHPQEKRNKEYKNWLPQGVEEDPHDRVHHKSHQQSPDITGKGNSFGMIQKEKGKHRFHQHHSSKFSKEPEETMYFVPSNEKERNRPIDNLEKNHQYQFEDDNESHTDSDYFDGTYQYDSKINTRGSANDDEYTNYKFPDQKNERHVKNDPGYSHIENDPYDNYKNIAERKHNIGNKHKPHYHKDQYENYSGLHEENLQNEPRQHDISSSSFDGYSKSHENNYNVRSKTKPSNVDTSPYDDYVIHGQEQNSASGPKLNDNNDNIPYKDYNIVIDQDDNARNIPVRPKVRSPYDNYVNKQEQTNRNEPQNSHVDSSPYDDYIFKQDQNIENEPRRSKDDFSPYDDYNQKMDQNIENEPRRSKDDFSPYDDYNQKMDQNIGNVPNVDRSPYDNYIPRKENKISEKEKYPTSRPNPHFHGKDTYNVNKYEDDDKFEVDGSYGSHNDEDDGYNYHQNVQKPKSREDSPDHSNDKYLKQFESSRKSHNYSPHESNTNSDEDYSKFNDNLQNHRYDSGSKYENPDRSFKKSEFHSSLEPSISRSQTQESKDVDDLSLHHIAGPPYHDEVGPAVKTSYPTEDQTGYVNLHDIEERKRVYEEKVETGTYKENNFYEIETPNDLKQATPIYNPSNEPQHFNQFKPHKTSQSTPEIPRFREDKPVEPSIEILASAKKNNDKIKNEKHHSYHDTQYPPRNEIESPDFGTLPEFGKKETMFEASIRPHGTEDIAHLLNSGDIVAHVNLDDLDEFTKLDEPDAFYDMLDDGKSPMDVVFIDDHSEPHRSRTSSRYSSASREEQYRDRPTRSRRPMRSEEKRRPPSDNFSRDHRPSDRYEVNNNQRNRFRSPQRSRERDVRKSPNPRAPGESGNWNIGNLFNFGLPSDIFG